MLSFDGTYKLNTYATYPESYNFTLSRVKGINYLHGAESSTGWQLLSWSIKFPTTGPYSEPVESSPHSYTIKWTTTNISYTICRHVWGILPYLSHYFPKNLSQ